MKDDSLILCKLFLRFAKDYDLTSQIINNCARLKYFSKYSKLSHIGILQELFKYFGYLGIFEFMLNYSVYSPVYCALWYYKILHCPKISTDSKIYKKNLKDILKRTQEKLFLDIITEDQYLLLLYAADV